MDHCWASWSFILKKELVRVGQQTRRVTFLGAIAKIFVEKDETIRPMTMSMNDNEIRHSSVVPDTIKAWESRGFVPSEFYSFKYEACCFKISRCNILKWHLPLLFIIFPSAFSLLFFLLLFFCCFIMLPLLRYRKYTNSFNIRVKINRKRNFLKLCQKSISRYLLDQLACLPQLH